LWMFKHNSVIFLKGHVPHDQSRVFSGGFLIDD
jgi:hypothetical protein